MRVFRKGKASIKKDETNSNSIIEKKKQSRAPYMLGFAKAGAISLALSTSVSPVARVYTVIRKPPPRPILWWWVCK